MPRYSMVLEYLPTKLGHFWGFYVGKYSSTMVRIWDMCIFYTSDYGFISKWDTYKSFAVKNMFPTSVAIHWGDP